MGEVEDHRDAAPGSRGPNGPAQASSTACGKEPVREPGYPLQNQGARAGMTTLTWGRQLAPTEGEQSLTGAGTHPPVAAGAIPKGGCRGPPRTGPEGSLTA